MVLTVLSMAVEAVAAVQAYYICKNVKQLRK